MAEICNKYKSFCYLCKECGRLRIINGSAKSGKVKGYCKERCKECGELKLIDRESKNKKNDRKEEKAAKQTTKEMGKVLFDNLNLAKKDAHKNFKNIKSFEEIDWSFYENIGKIVKLQSFALENVQVLC